MNGLEHTARITHRVYRHAGFLLFLCGVMLCANGAFAQGAAVSGRVIDPSGAIIPNAEITLTREGTGDARSTRSNSDGLCAFSFVRAGKYTLTATAASFKRSGLSGVIIETGQAAAIDIRLEIGQQSEIVTVDGGGIILNTVNAAVSTIVDREFIGNVPLNGRTLQSLMTVVPGVVAAPSIGTNVGGGISVNGQRTEANYFTVDGLSANSGVTAGQVTGYGAGYSGSLPATTTLGTTQSMASLDAMEEFRALTSTYSAEYGRTPGGQFSLTTRSGTNDWHGSLYNYFRNDKLNANNWFNNEARIPRNIERQNDFGGTLGGPVSIPGVYSGKDRSFFFFSYEGMRLRLPQAAIVTAVPTVQLRNSAPAEFRPFLNAYPLPNGRELAEGLAEFRAGYSAPASINATGLRVDHSLSNSVKLFGRYNGTPSESLSRITDNLAVLNALTGNAQTVMGGVTASLSPSITLDARANGTWNDGAFKASMDNLGGATPLRLEDVPGFDSTGDLNVGLRWGPRPVLRLRPRVTEQRQFNTTAALGVVAGQHTLKIGMDYRRTDSRGTIPSLAAYVYYSSVDEVQRNVPRIFSMVKGAGNAQQIYTNFSAFIQDEWQVRQGLSLSLGLRWEVNPAPAAVGAAQYLRTLDQTENLATAQLAPVGTPLWKTQWTSFAPRLGLAYKLRGTPGRETVLRAGTGLFYDTGNTQAAGGYYYGPADYYGTTGRSFPIPASEIPALSVSPAPAVYAFDPNLELPLSLHWNVSLEQALSSQQTIKVGYVASAAMRLLRIQQYSGVNSAIPTILVTTNDGRSDYNSMQVEYQLRMSRGLQILGSYTWAHALDNGSGNLVWGLPLQRANSDFDIRHNAQLALSYQLPGNWALTRNWSVSARVSARSALPLDIQSVQAVTDPATLLLTTLHPNVIPGQPLYLSDPNAPGGRRVNFAAFQAAPGGVDGNLGRNALRGFNAIQTDLAVLRNFRLKERLSLQVRAEAFNAFNRANFGTIYNQLSVGQTLFGIASNTLNSQLGGMSPLYQMGGPRSMQLALKLQF